MRKARYRTFAADARSANALRIHAVVLGFFLAAAQAAPTANRDFNVDGKADVLWRNGSTGDNYLYPMDAKQILSSEGYLRAVADSHWNIAGIGDFDGDDRADLLWRHSTTGENYVYFMNGTGVSSEGYLRTVADTAWKVAGIGDFDGDGRDDILWRNAATGENYIYLLNGLAISAEGYVRTVSNLAWKVAGVGDTDGDGKADILWRNSTTGENYLYPMSGTTILGTEGYLRTVADANWRVAGIGDVNGDTTADIVWRNSLTGENYLYPLNGRTILSGEGYIRTVADLNWQVAMVGDFDGNGTADILWRHAATGENYIYFMSGTTILPTEGFIRTVAELGWQVLPFSAGRTDAPWGASTIISNQRDFMSYDIATPIVALTSQHVGFVAWHEEWGDCGRIFVNRNAGGVWASGTGSDIGTTHALSPHIAANSNGDAVVVWVERDWSGTNCSGGITGSEIWANRYSAASGLWSGAVRVSVDAPADNTIYTFGPAAALDDAGRATVAWIQGGDIWYSRFDGTWSAPALLSDSPANSNEPKLALDAAGNVLAVWVRDTNAYNPSLPGGGPSLPNVWSARFDAGAGTWSTPARIGSPDLSGTEGTERPRLAVNASGNAVAIWQESRGSNGMSSIVGARFSAASGTWTAPVALEANTTQHAYWPEVAIDAAGNAQAVWIQRIDASESYESGYTARMNAATGTWSAPLLFEQSPNVVAEPRVGMDSGGRATIAWNQILSGVPPVHAVHYTPATGFGPVSHFQGDRLVLAVNGAGTALLATKLMSTSGPTFVMLVRAAMLRP